MGDNIFLKEMKEIQFEDYFKYDAKCRGNLGDELPVMVYRMLEYSLKDELKKNTRDSRFLDEPEELDWLVPTRPDTPEEIARKKAEKKLQEKELMAEEEKTEIKPDPSQMSLW